MGFLALGVGFLAAAVRPASKTALRESEPPTYSETVVAYANATKSIEDIRPGDVVQALDEETGEVVAKRVVRVFRNETDHLRVVTIRSSDNTTLQTLRTTDEHPFYVQGRGWVEAQKLEVGQQLVEANGLSSTIVSCVREDLGEPEPVYNFEVEDAHNYFVSETGLDAPVLAHNTCARPIGSTRGIRLTPANNGAYTIRFKSGKVYVGKGGTTRARRSARQRSRENNDPVESITHSPASNDGEAFRMEARKLRNAGGPGSNRNYNEINSPGRPEI
jgi:hypothetical protein